VHNPSLTRQGLRPRYPFGIWSQEQQKPDKLYQSIAAALDELVAAVGLKPAA
jgi:hypothetical protein